MRSVLVVLFTLSNAIWAAYGRCPPGTKRVIINFDRLPNGKWTVAGEMVSDQWENVGVKLSGRRRRTRKGRTFEDTPALRVFDSAHPTGGDFDLGSPNEGCEICKDPNISCPGVATKNLKEAASTNCWKQRKILIIDSGKKNPNDFRKGGEIVISFVVPVPKVLSLGFMDVTPAHNVPSSNYTIFDSNNKLLVVNSISGLGDNTWQVERVNYRGDISTIKLDMYGSFGFTHLKFCAAVPVPPPTPAPMTEPPDTSPPSPAPVLCTPEPTPTPSLHPVFFTPTPTPMTVPPVSITSPTPEPTNPPVIPPSDPGPGCPESYEDIPQFSICTQSRACFYTMPSGFIPGCPLCTSVFCQCSKGDPWECTA